MTICVNTVPSEHTQGRGNRNGGQGELGLSSLPPDERIAVFGWHLDIARVLRRFAVEEISLWADIRLKAIEGQGASLEVSRYHNGKYRVNVCQQPVPNKDFAVTFAPRIGLSYFSFHEKQAAQESVAGIDGVTQVVNGVDVLLVPPQPALAQKTTCHLLPS